MNGGDDRGGGCLGPKVFCQWEEKMILIMMCKHWIMSLSISNCWDWGVVFFI
jgi:hypothetical protein